MVQAVLLFWEGDLGFVDRNFQDSGGGTCGIPQTGDGSEGQATDVRDLEKRGSGKGNQGSGNPDNWGIH